MKRKKLESEEKSTEESTTSSSQAKSEPEDDEGKSKGKDYWMNLYVQKDKKYDRLVKEYDRLVKEMNRIKDKNTEMEVEIRDLAVRLEHAYNRILSFNSMLTARGVMKFVEQSPMFGVPSYLGRTHEAKWDWLFRTNSTIEGKIKHYVDPTISAVDVGKLAARVYGKASKSIHTFSKRDGVEIYRADFHDDERHFIKAVCRAIPCSYYEY